MRNPKDRRSFRATDKYAHPGNPLWECRTQKYGLTQAEFADVIYVSRSQICVMERGEQRLTDYVKEWLAKEGYQCE